jgi:hypothetical protein
VVNLFLLKKGISRVKKMASTGKVDKSAFEKKGNTTSSDSAKGKAALFEKAAKEAGPQKVQVKTTWNTTGNSGGHGGDGKYKGRKQIGDGPAPKKSLNDLP